MRKIGFELRYALRQMRSAPLFTLVVVGMLAIVIGATVALFWGVPDFELRSTDTRWRLSPHEPKLIFDKLIGGRRPASPSTTRGGAVERG